MAMFLSLQALIGERDRGLRWTPLAALDRRCHAAECSEFGGESKVSRIAEGWITRAQSED